MAIKIVTSLNEFNKNNLPEEDSKDEKNPFFPFSNTSAKKIGHNFIIHPIKINKMPFYSSRGYSL